MILGQWCVYHACINAKHVLHLLHVLPVMHPFPGRCLVGHVSAMWDYMMMGAMLFVNPAYTLVLPVVILPHVLHAMLPSIEC